MLIHYSKSAEYSIREIAGFPGYGIDPDGQPWTRWKRVGIKGLGKGRRGTKMIISDHWRPMKLIRTSTSYFCVNLHRNGVSDQKLVNYLVLEAFVGERPRGMLCRHLNGDPQDNRLTNLAWGTYKENEDDKKLHGRVPIGIRHHNAKLDDEKVAEIRQRRAAGEPLRSLARRFHVDRATINSVCKYETWKHVA